MVIAKVALSLTGSGHLFIYQLGASKHLLDSGIPVNHIAGSSGGAIAASVLSILPEKVESFAQDFIGQKESGIALLRKYLESTDASCFQQPIQLEICATRCRDGQATMFSSPWDKEHLFACVEASCSIPPSFHPADIFLSANISFPEEDGVLIEGDNYVDGGIAAPAPPTPSSMERVVISPISGSADICPKDPYRFFSMGTRGGGFRINASFQNLRALRASAGLTSSTELQSYYDMGRRDAELYVKGRRLD